MVMARKFHAFVGYPSDIVNKARLYDESTSQSGMSSGAKVIRCMVDYSTKIEKLLREMHILLQPAGLQLEPALATQQSTPTPTSIPAASPEVVTLPTGRPNPTLQEVIPEINTEDIISLEQWAVGGLQNMATLTSGSQVTTIPGSHSMPGFVKQEARRKAEDHTKRRAEESVSKSRSSSEDEKEEDPVKHCIH